MHAGWDAAVTVGHGRPQSMLTQVWVVLWHGMSWHGVAWLDLVDDGVELEGERERLAVQKEL